MPAEVLYPNVGCLYEQGLLGADLANCKVRLFKSDLVISVSTVLADLTAIEADFGGYAAKTVTALLAAYLDPAGGVTQQIPTQQWNASGVAPANIVYGWWVETAGGDLVLVGKFEAGISMENVGDSLPLNIAFSFGR